MHSVGCGISSLSDVFPVISMQDSLPTSTSNGGLLSVCGISNGAHSDVASRFKYLGLNISPSLGHNSNVANAVFNEDRSRTNLIINYLPQSYDQNDLQRLFERVGPIRQCKLIRDKNTGASLCYGFVDFVNPHHAALAIQTYHGYETEQKRLRVAYASSGGRRFNSGRLPTFLNGSGLSNGLPNDVTNENIIGWEIFVIGIPVEWTESDLTRLFNNFGSVILVRLLAPQMNDSPPCHKPRLSSPILNGAPGDLGSDNGDGCRLTTTASVIFEDKSNAEAAVLRLNGYQLQEWTSPLGLRIIGAVSRETYRLFCLPSSQSMISRVPSIQNDPLSESEILSNLLNRRAFGQSNSLSHTSIKHIEGALLPSDISPGNQNTFAPPRAIIRNKMNEVLNQGLPQGHSLDLLEYLDNQSSNHNINASNGASNTDRLSSRELSLVNALIAHRLSDSDSKIDHSARPVGTNSTSPWSFPQNRCGSINDTLRGGDALPHGLVCGGVKRLSIRTPLILSQTLTNVASQLGCQAQIYLKLENIQPTGSFKIRGMDNVCRKWSAAGVNHIVCPSGGNSAIAAAYAAQAFGISCTIVTPETGEQFVRRRLMVEAPDAKVIVHGSDWLEACHRAEQFVNDLHAASHNCDSVRLLHPYDQSELWEGYETMIEELAPEIGQPDAVVVPVGGGGLLAGVIQGLWNQGWSSTHVIAVETDASDCFNRTMKAGHLLSVQRTTSIATSLVAPVLAPRAWNLAQCQSLSAVTCSETDALDAVKRFIDDHGMLVEPACGAVLSTIYSGVINRLQLGGRIPRPATVVCIISGGSNVSMRQLIEWENQLSRFTSDHVISSLLPSVANYHIPQSNFLSDLSRTSPLCSVTSALDLKTSCNSFDTQDPVEAKLGVNTIAGEISLSNAVRSISSLLMRPIQSVDSTTPSAFGIAHGINGIASALSDHPGDDGADVIGCSSIGSLNPHDLVNFSKLLASSDTDGQDVVVLHE